MSTTDTDNRVVDLAVNRLFRIGLDLHGALALVDPQSPDQVAGQRIRAAIARIDETIGELRLAVMNGER
ncbi:MAG: hypothetical protein GEV28_11115 [Actinophytocola sp.]|uniref:hypothetical protein n=1 Tax=Actinophytocola sp. TaxID=1872138 RepID=UPI0013223E25|nr:hypothetical protein [Actinophytocola sp.]MPZ80906.1 hypothetical protein [Actinophytocola sp.]